MHAPNRRTAVSLIELVASTVSLVLLAACLAPALAEAGRRGKDTVCLQNLARIAQSSISYAAEDPDEQAVPVHTSVLSPAIASDLRISLAAMAWGGKSGRGREDTDPFFWGTGRGRGPATRPLNHILYGDVFPDYRFSAGGPGAPNWKADEALKLDAYRCPSDNGYAGLHDESWQISRLTSYDHYGSSYAASTLWLYVGGYGARYMSGSAYLHALSAISNSRETIFYLENCGKLAYLANPGGAGCGQGDPSVVNGWHGQSWLFNTSFVDGHAAATFIRGTYNPHIGHYPEDFGWPDPHQAWRCAIVRGDQWQIDSLPAPPVQTTIPAPYPYEGDARSGDSWEEGVRAYVPSPVR